MYTYKHTYIYIYTYTYTFITTTRRPTTPSGCRAIASSSARCWAKADREPAGRAALEP